MLRKGKVPKKYGNIDIDKRTPGNLMKIHRISNNLTQTKMAEIIGVTRDTIARYERDEIRPSEANKIKIAKLFGMNVSTLFFDEE